MVVGADPGFFLGAGALVSCSTSTPINHIVFFFFFFLQNTSCIIDHKNDIKMFKTLQCYPTRLRFVCGSWLQLNSEHIDAISMVDKSKDHGKCRLLASA